MDDGWEDDWSFDDEDEGTEIQISSSQDDAQVQKNAIDQKVVFSNKQIQNDLQAPTVKATAPTDQNKAPPILLNVDPEGVVPPPPGQPLKRPEESSQAAPIRLTVEPKLQVLQTYLLDQLQSYSLQFTTNQLALRDDCNRRFHDAFSSSGTLDELARYYSNTKQESLFKYTLQKEVPRMDYRVLVADPSRRQGGGGGMAIKTLSSAQEIQSHFLSYSQGSGEENKATATVDTTSLEHLILRSANQSLLADALAMLTTPDGLVRPQYFTTATATSVSFVVDTVRGSVNCQSTLEIGIPSIGDTSSQREGGRNRVELATVLLNMVYIPPYSPPRYQLHDNQDYETRVPRLECHVVEVRPAPLLKSSPEIFLHSLKQAANSLAVTWLEMGYSEPALEEMLGNVAQGHAAHMQQQQHALSARINFNTVQSLREALLTNDNYHQANAALTQAAAKSSTGFASAWQQLDSATGLGSKVKFLSNVSFLPSADVLALEDDDATDDGYNQSTDAERYRRPPTQSRESTFPRPSPPRQEAPQGLFPGLQPKAQTSGPNQRGAFPSPPQQQQGLFPSPPQQQQGLFPSLPQNQQGLFPRPPSQEEERTFPRPLAQQPTSLHHQQGLFPRPPPPQQQNSAADHSRSFEDRGLSESVKGMFPRPQQQPNANVDAFSRPTQEREQKPGQGAGMLSRPQQQSNPNAGMFPRPSESMGPSTSSRHVKQPPPVSSQQQVHSQNVPMIGGLLFSGLSRVAKSMAAPPPSPVGAGGPKLYNKEMSKLSPTRTATPKNQEADAGDGWSDDDIDLDDNEVVDDSRVSATQSPPLPPQDYTETDSNWKYPDVALPRDGDPHFVPREFQKEIEFLAERLRNGEHWRDIKAGKPPAPKRKESDSSSIGAEFVKIPDLNDPAWKRLLEKEDPFDDGFDSENHPDDVQETRTRWTSSRSMIAASGAERDGANSNRRLWFDYC
jgi:hypothetical protein